MDGLKGILKEPAAHQGQTSSSAAGAGAGA